MSNGAGRPEWLEIAQERLSRRSRPDVRDSWPRLPVPGEIHIADAMAEQGAEPRMVFVLAVTPTTGSAEVALLSHEVDLATDRDLLLQRAESGLPFDLLVESDLVARVWLIQLGRLVVSLDADRVASVMRAVTGGQTSASSAALPIQGTADPRSVFKDEECAALDALSHDCSSHLEGGWRPPVVVDPAVLDRGDRESVDDHLGRLLATAEQLLGSETRVVPDGAADRLPSSGLQDHDTLRALAPIFEAALREPSSGTDHPIRFDPDREFEADQDDELYALVPPIIEAGGRSVLLLTVPEAWSGGMGAATSLATATIGESGPVQIVRHDVEEAW